eukprot:328499_1
MTTFVVLLLILNAAIGKQIFRLIENNNHPNVPYKAIGHWTSWLTGYHVNEKHNGYIDIGTRTFNAENLNLLYTADTNCTNNYPLFANGRIYCVSKNMLFSYYPQNGSISFWYLFIGSISLSNPTFAQSDEYYSIFVFSASSSVLYISSFDAMTGELKKTTTLPSSSGYYLTYAVGTPYGTVYLTSKNVSGSSPNASVFAYNIDSNDFTQSEANVEGVSEVPSFCNFKVIVSGLLAYTNAYSDAPNFNNEWIFNGEGPSSSSASGSPPVCFRDINGYRVVVKPYSNINYNCYLLNSGNGELKNQFACGTLPIFHYHKSLGFADIAIIGTGVSNQILVTEIHNDNIIGKELWYGDGSTDYGFIVADYFVTMIKRDSDTLVAKVYNIFNGDVVWQQLYDDQPYSATYSIFGSLYDNDGIDQFMIVVRIANQLYAYTENDIIH